LIIPGLFSSGKFGIVPDPPEYGECYGYWEDPDHFDLINCKGCEMYEECLKASEEDNEVSK